ncbi:MAG: hypothetical protein H6838_11270 [Planctomycetes bacterium]|nr:hypothetical protein [Planctomycetota bacterium]MCB9886066.1 hypothetical protein [Planctomycetota bacterium]
MSRRSASALGLLLVSACAGAPNVNLAPGPASLTAAEFPGAARLLDGFSPFTFASEWVPGDTVLYGLRLRRGDQQQRWLLRLHLDEVDAGGAPLRWDLQVNGGLQRFESALSRVTATVADADGNVLGGSRPQMPRDFLARGFAPACEQVRAYREDHPEAEAGQGFYEGVDARLLAEAVVSAMALLDTVRNDPLLSPILWQVVQRPSLLSVIGNLGVSVVVQPRFLRATETVPPISEMPHGAVWRVPIDLFVNDAPALVAELVVGTSLPPFGVGGGILAAIARHPSDPEVEFEVLLLAARRGAAPLRAAAVSDPN